MDTDTALRGSTAPDAGRASAPTTGDRRPAHAPDRATRVLVTAGVVAGPLFVIVGLVQAVTRDGFDLTRHPLSLLSLGDRGWVQIANFIIAGVLMLLFAAGTRRSLGGVMRDRDHSGQPTFEVVEERWEKRWVRTRIEGAVIVGAT